MWCSDRFMPRNNRPRRRWIPSLLALCLVLVPAGLTLADSRYELLSAAGAGDLDKVGSLLLAGTDPNLQNAQGDTALLLAVQGGHLKLVDYLLAHGARVDLPGARRTTPLLLVIRNNFASPALLRRLLEAGTNPNLRDGDGRTALLQAAAQGREDIVALLLEHGAKPDLADHNGVTPLMWAAWRNRPDIVQQLLDAGAEPNLRDHQGNTALLAGIRNSNGVTEAGEVLLRKGADPNITNHAGTTPLMEAAQRGYQRMVRTLLSRGADPDLQDLEAGRTALLAAIEAGHTPVIRTLLRATRGLDRPARDGTTPLLLALKKSNTSLVRALLDRGADPNLADQAGTTPMAMAMRTQFCNDALFRALLDHKAAVDATTSAGQPLLSWSITLGCTDLALVLIGAGANVNALDRQRTSPLVHAMANRYPALAKALLAHGADPGIKNSQGVSALALAVDQWHPDHDLIRDLLLRGADPNARDRMETPVVVVAARRGDANTVRLLVGHGADVDAIDQNGLTALMVAAKQGDADIVRLLLAAGARIDAEDFIFGDTALAKAQLAGHSEIEALLGEVHTVQGSPAPPIGGLPVGLEVH